MKEKVYTEEEVVAKRELFLNMVEEDHIYLYEPADFKSICRLIDVPENILDRSLQRELGVHGQELLLLLKKGYIDFIIKKYGLNVGIAR